MPRKAITDEERSACTFRLSFWITDREYETHWSRIKSFLSRDKDDGFFVDEFAFNQVTMDGSPYIITVDFSYWLNMFAFHHWLCRQGISVHG